MITQQDIDDMGYSYHDEVVRRPTLPEMVDEFAKTMGQQPNFNMSGNLIREEYNEWHKEFYEFGPSVKELKELSDLTYVIFGYARVRGWNLLEAVSRVHENNMGRCVQPDGSIKRREDGKVLKNPDYPAVDLSDLV